MNKICCIYLIINETQLVESVFLADLLRLFLRYSTVCNFKSLKAIFKWNSFWDCLQQVGESLRARFPISVIWIAAGMHAQIANVADIQLRVELELAVQRDFWISDEQLVYIFCWDNQFYEVCHRKVNIINKKLFCRVGCSQTKLFYVFTWL